MVETETTFAPGESPAADASPRVELARLALEASLGVDGVVASDGGLGGLRATLDGESRLAGVRATAVADGRYGVELFLVVRPLPLQSLAEEVRVRVRREAVRHGLADLLGPVGITITDLVGSTVEQF